MKKGGMVVLLLAMGWARPLVGQAAIEPLEIEPSVIVERPVPMTPVPVTPVPVTIEATPSATEEEEKMPRPYAPLRSPTTCPEDIETLTTLLIRDIPNYTNRVLQRAIAALAGNDIDGREPYRPSHVLIAGHSELAPLDLNDYAFTTDPAAGGPLSQLFFTTQSRQYSGLHFDEVQEYHWLFLTKTTDGWRLAFMFSVVDNVAPMSAPVPPRESSEGSVGKAVQLWLRDCRAGTIDALNGL